MPGKPDRLIAGKCDTRRDIRRVNTGKKEELGSFIADEMRCHNARSVTYRFVSRNPKS